MKQYPLEGILKEIGSATVKLKQKVTSGMLKNHYLWRELAVPRPPQLLSSKHLIC
jgi:hypothetical protein